LTSAALRYLRECLHFKNETGLAHGKASELLSTIIANRWLAANGYPWTIELSPKPIGVDGNIVGDIDGPGHVEFKSSASRSASFQFHRDFEYGSHGCLVFTVLLDAVPSRVILVFGKQSIQAVQSMAQADMTRLNFGDKKNAMALVHLTAKPASAQRKEAIKGLVDYVGAGQPGDRNDRVVMIEGAQLAELLAA
jgi:hypothetical protein